jgi:hypothetical protein
MRVDTPNASYWKGDSLDNNSVKCSQSLHANKGESDFNHNGLPYNSVKRVIKSKITKSTSDIQQALVSSHLISQKGARDAFIDWQGFIADSHPSDKCRRGAQDILDELDDLWPKDNYSPGTVRSNLLTKKQCLSDYSDVKYQGCAVGGNPGAYTCGLWQTFHAMSVAPDTKFGGTEMFRRLGQFIKYFFTSPTESTEEAATGTTEIPRFYPIGTPGKPWTDDERNQWKATRKYHRSYM